MEVVRAQASGARQSVELWLLLGRLDQSAGLGDLAGMLLEKGGLVRLAPLAWPEARCLGVRGRFVEADVLALCPSGRTRRSTIDAGRCYRGEKKSIASGIARGKGRPSRVVEGGRRGAGQRLGWLAMAHDLGSEVIATGLDLVLAKRARTPILAVKPISLEAYAASQRPQLRASARDASCRPH